MSDSEEYEIERILSDRVKNGKLQYLVKWRGYDDEECQWIPAENFTLELSIREWEKQKAAGDCLPDEFLATLQKKMDDFAARNRLNNQDNSLVKEQAASSHDKDSAHPKKRQKRVHDSDTVSRTKHGTQKLEPPRKKGIATHIKPPNGPKSVSSTSKPSISNTGTTPRIDRPAGHGTNNLPSSKAGQLFRNLSHQNAARKKLGAEPPPNLPPDRLKSVADFDIGREAAHILPPVLHRSPQDQGNSPLFIPESNEYGNGNVTSPAGSDSMVFPPARVDHKQDEEIRSNVPLRNTAIPTGPRSMTVRTDAEGLRNGNMDKPRLEYPLAETPPNSQLIHAKNGRSWYRGDVLCLFRIGRVELGDATIVNIDHQGYKEQLLTINQLGKQTFPFEGPFDRHAFERSFSNHDTVPWSLGLVNPFPDTQEAFDELAEELERRDSAAVCLIKNPSVKFGFVLYSVRAKSWSQIGWRAARRGQPRLHVAFVPNLARNTSPQSLQTPKMQVDTDINSLNKEPARLSVQQNPQPPSRKRTHSVSERRARSPSLSIGMADLELKSNATSPAVHSEAYTSGAESPNTDWTSHETTPVTMTPISPGFVQPTTHDPRLRRRSTNASQAPPIAEVRDKANLKSLNNHHRLDYKTLISSYPLNVKSKFDYKKAQFFVSFASNLHIKEAKEIQQWLEKYIHLPSNIYLDSERHAWPRFLEKTETTISVLLFLEKDLNYHRLPNLGQVLLSDVPACFSLQLQENLTETIDLKKARIRKIFPRKVLYLITESMIIHNLDQTLIVIDYFDNNKKPGYKMMVPPNIEQLLLEQSSRERDEVIRNKLIDLLLMIRKLQPVPDSAVDMDDPAYFSLTSASHNSESSHKVSYIIYPTHIPGHNQHSQSALLEASKDSDMAATKAKFRDDVLKSYFYCYSAMHVANYRKFIVFYTNAEAEQHRKTLKQKEEDNKLDCGHIIFWELEKFVKRFQTQAEPRED